MTAEFTGKYFNGLSSRAYPCRVSLGGSSFQIRVLDESGNETQAVRWEVSQIVKNDIDFSHKIRLSYGAFPHQTLEVEDGEFVAALGRMYPYHAFAKRDMVAVVSSRWKWVVAAFLLLLGFGVFAFVVVVPGVAEYAATKVPLSVEQAIGESAYGQLTTLAKEDTLQSRLVQEFFEAIPGKRNYRYTITVLKSQQRNAFAVPGGRIAVYSGILEDMEKPEELAALLLHESAHVEAQHSLKSLFRTLSGYFFISLLFGDAGGVTAAVFQNIYVFQDLQYSRAMEREADMTGLESMRQAGIDPRGMVELFRSLEEHSPALVSKYEVSEFMSTHPLTKHRISYIEEYIAENKAQYDTISVLEMLFNKLKSSYL